MWNPTLRARRAWLACSLALCACVACTRSENGPEPRASARQVALRTVDEHGLQQLIAQHRGKVVLVDFWATWCPTCLELFPHTVELSRRFGDRGLIVVAVSLDNEGSRPDVSEFLVSQGATFDTLLSKYGASGESTQRFRIENDALPNLKLHDRRGKLVATFRGTIEPAEIDRAVEQALRE